MKKNLLGKLLAGAGLMVVAASSFAVTPPPDFTPLTGAIDFSTTITAVMAISVLCATLYLAVTGAKKVLHFLKSA